MEGQPNHDWNANEVTPRADPPTTESGPFALSPEERRAIADAHPGLARYVTDPEVTTKPNAQAKGDSPLTDEQRELIAERYPGLRRYM